MTDHPTIDHLHSLGTEQAESENFDQNLFKALDAARGTDKKFSVAIHFLNPVHPPTDGLPHPSQYHCRRDWRDALGVFYASHYEAWCRSVRIMCHTRGLAVEDLTRSGGIAIVYGLSDNIFALSAWEHVCGVFDPHKTYELALLGAFV